MHKYFFPLTLNMRLRGRFQILHCVKQAALKNTGAAALTHDPDAALLVQFTWLATILIVRTGLAQSPTPLSFILKLLGLTDDITAWRRRGTGGRRCGIKRYCCYGHTMKAFTGGTG